MADFQLVTVDQADYVLSPTNAGFSDALTQLTMVFWTCSPVPNLDVLANRETGFFACDFGLAWNPLLLGRFSIDADDYPYWDFGASVIADPPAVTSILFSLDLATQTIQVYVNDVLCAATLQEGAWPAAILNPRQWQAWVQPGGDPAGVGDLWIDERFIDFSIEANRRKFVAADLSPVYPGSDGSLPFGTAPLVFLHVETDADSFADNLGTGGAWSVVGGPLALDTDCAATYLPVGSADINSTVSENPFSFTTSIVGLFQIPSNPDLSTPSVIPVTLSPALAIYGVASKGADFYEIPLRPESATFRISLSGKVYQFSVVWRDNDQGGWFLGISDFNGQPLVLGIPMVTGLNLLYQFGYLGIGADGSGLFMISDKDAFVGPSYDSLGTSCKLYYVVPKTPTI